jgi:hypothetical protein
MNTPRVIYQSPSGNGKVVSIAVQGCGWAATLGSLMHPLGGKRRFVAKSQGFQMKHLFRVGEQNISQEVKKRLESQR